MKSNRLQLNSSKTEVMWCATGHRQHILPALSVDGIMVDLVTSFRNLGFYIDDDLCMETHVQRTRSTNRVWCFCQLQQIRRHILPAPFQTLDYGNGVLVGLSTLPTLYADSSQYLMRLHG